MEYDSEEDAKIAWQDSNDYQSCNCHRCPPCSFCMGGFSLEIEEFLDLYYRQPLAENLKTAAAVRDGFESEFIPKKEGLDTKEEFYRGSIRRMFRLPTPP